MNNMLFENQAIAKMFQYTIPPPGQMPTIPNLNLSAPTFETAIKLSNPDLSTQLTAACTQVQQAQQQQQQAQQQALVALPQLTTQQPQPPQQQQQQQPPQQQSQQPLPIPQTTNTNSTSSGRSTPNNLDSSAAGKLFVGGLSWQTSSDKLKEYFGRYGTVTDVLIMKDPATQRSRGFGFITFAEANSVENVLRNPLHLLDGKKIDPKHATPKNKPKQANKTKKIFVGGVSQETSSDEVKTYFNQFGKVEETVMLMDQQTKRHRGFGFVTFESEDVVDRVCEIHYHMIKNKKVECKKAQPKEMVTTGAQMLQKRILLGGLGGIRLAPTSPLLGTTVATGNPLAAHLQTAANTATQMMPHHHAAAAAAAAFQMQNAAQYQNCVQNVPAGGYGKIFATYPQAALHGFRYAPYGLPANAAAAAAQMQAAAATNAPQPTTGHTPQNQVQPAALTPVAAQNPYQGYSLANIDMSSFQGVDWSSMYGMYV